MTTERVAEAMTLIKQNMRPDEWVGTHELAERVEHGNAWAHRHMTDMATAGQLLKRKDSRKYVFALLNGTGGQQPAVQSEPEEVNDTPVVPVGDPEPAEQPPVAEAAQEKLPLLDGMEDLDEIPLDNKEFCILGTVEYEVSVSYLQTLFAGKNEEEVYAELSSGEQFASDFKNFCRVCQDALRAAGDNRTRVRTWRAVAKVVVQ